MVSLPEPRDEWQGFPVVLIAISTKFRPDIWPNMIPEWPSLFIRSVGEGAAAESEIYRHREVRLDTLG